MEILAYITDKTIACKQSKIIHSNNMQMYAIHLKLLPLTHKIRRVHKIILNIVQNNIGL